MGNPDEFSQMHSSINYKVTTRTNEQAFIDEFKQQSISVINWNSQNICIFPAMENANFPSQITHLYLNFNCISKLPQGLPQVLKSLQIFSMDGNELSKLPDDLGFILSLEELHFSENKLTSLPDSLCHLSKLKILKVCNNALRSLHREIGQNTCLEILKVDENHLKRFPPTLGLLKNLKVLEANCNKINVLPETFHFLESLETVDFSKNRLSTLPKCVSELEHLKHIDLSENQLVSLWETCKSSSCLEKIYLDFNSIITLPSWFSDLDHVLEITLNSNNLSSNSLPESFGSNLPCLKLLDLRGNYITDLPDSFGGLHTLETLHLGSPFDYLEKKATFQNGNWLSCLPTSFGELQNLVLLGAQENQLVSLPDSIGNLINLKEIYLGSNILTSLPDSFCQLKYLQKCQLSKNKLKVLPEDFGNLDSLIELHLDLNKLKNLPVSMRNCVNLEILDLSDNRLAIVPSEILACLSKLKALNMHQNRFDVPYSDIPHIAKNAHYCELNPVHRNNWRGKNNSPYSDQGNFLHTKEVQKKTEDKRKSPNPLERDSGSNIAECDDQNEQVSVDSNDDKAYWDSSDEEDWEKECSLPGTNADLITQPQLEEEENWDSEIVSPSTKRNELSGIKVGQFDLDEEDLHKPSMFQSLVFDFYGNPSSRIDLDICQHRMLPYVFHSRNHFPFTREPGVVEDGQFEDFQD